tara:strand:+ start:208 stop:582 length:375 start_codon:yes stop_codon:yes gene_type:complete
MDCEAMNIIDKLNEEFDVVQSENIELQKKIKQLESQNDDQRKMMFNLMVKILETTDVEERVEEIKIHDNFDINLCKKINMYVDIETHVNKLDWSCIESKIKYDWGCDKVFLTSEFEDDDDDDDE